jgi:prolyl-tRNA editing enzyme YbaK/EbsC (Cys-tRNA(Pro) deacylase)
LAAGCYRPSLFEVEMLSTSAQKVQAVLEALGFSCRVVEMAETTRSAGEAAEAVGCTVGQIAKSLVFRKKRSGEPLLVIASGANRVNEKLMGQMVGEPIERATPDFVREKTGFAIGGIPPVGHSEPLDTYLDEDLLQYEEIWAAAGNPNAVFKLTPSELKRMTQGRVAQVK